MSPFGRQIYKNSPFLMSPFGRQIYKNSPFLMSPFGRQIYKNRFIFMSYTTFVKVLIKNMFCMGH
jgi:hypothetical protein